MTTNLQKRIQSIDILRGIVIVFFKNKINLQMNNKKRTTISQKIYCLDNISAFCFEITALE